MGSTQQFSLKWNKYRQNWDRYLLRALTSHQFSDVMVACDGEVFQLHRVVLASCSAYFEKTLQKIPAKETPIVMLSDVTEAELRTLIEFMYSGEATIDQGRLDSLLKAAERLQIRGLVRLPADGESSSDEEEEDAEEGAHRSSEHRQAAAAAALASRAPWPAERANTAAAATSGRPTPPPARQAQSETPPPPASSEHLDVTRLLSISVDADDTPPISAETPPPPADMSVTLAPPPAQQQQQPQMAPPQPLTALQQQLAAPPQQVTLQQHQQAEMAQPAAAATHEPAAVRPPMTPPELPHAHAAAAGGYKRNTSDSPHVQAAVRRIADGELTVAEASIQFDVPIPTLYLNMRRQGVKARGRLGMTGKRKPRTHSMSQEMRSALSEIESGAITASKASRKYNITLPRIMSWMRKMGVRSAYSRAQQGAAPPTPPEATGPLPAV